MRKFLKLSLLTAVFTLIMSAGVWAATTITSSEQLAEGQTYTDVEISGNATITVPGSGINVQSSAVSVPCITIKSGSNVTINGAAPTTAIKYSGTTNCNFFMRVEDGATLTLGNIVIDGGNKDDGSHENGKYYDGINNMGTLNITDGTVIQNFTFNPTSRMGAAVFNQGANCTFNMTGGEIKDNFFVGGGGLSVSAGTASISGGIIHDNGVNSVYHRGGTLEITGGLLVGQAAGISGVTGEYEAGTIEFNGITADSAVITDSTAGISVTAKNGDYFIANPAHEITTTVADKTYTAMYYQNIWHFVDLTSDAQGHDNEVYLDTNSINISVGDTKTVMATIVSSSGNYGTLTYVPKQSSYVEIVMEEKADPSSPTTVFKITGKAAGTESISISPTDNSSASVELTVKVVDSNVINSTSDMDPNKEYIDTRIINESIQGPSETNAITVTVPADGINVGSTEAGNCITIEKGAVKLTGGTINHVNNGDFSSRSLIKVNTGAMLILENITIDGKWKKGDTSLKDILTYGIENEGTVIIKSGTVINGINVDASLEDDAILYNTGTMTINGGAIYHNDNESYVLYNADNAPDANGTITVNGGVIVGKIPEGYKPEGSNQSGIVCGTVGDKITATGKEGTIEFSAEDGDSVLTGTGTTLKSGEITATYGAGRWDFTNDPAKVNVSYVKGENITKTKGTFGTSHIIDENAQTQDKTDIGTNFSVSTSFYDEQVDAVTDATDNNKYILIDMYIPNNSGYVKGAPGIKSLNVETSAGNSATVNINTTPELNDSVNSECLYELDNINVDNFNLKRKFIVEGADAGTQFGIIVDGIYSPGASAYIRDCTKAEYDSDTDYKEVTDENGIALVSLGLE